MTSFILILPMLFIRVVLLGLLNKEALQEATHFAPLGGNERLIYGSYQLSNLLLIVVPIFKKIQGESTLSLIGWSLYFLGVGLLLLATINFARPKKQGLRTRGLYRFSRNPMYVAYFCYYLGCVLLTHSLILGGSLIVFQASSHWLVLAEERWCQETYGESYLNYQQKVGRYL